MTLARTDAMHDGRLARLCIALEEYADAYGMATVVDLLGYIAEKRMDSARDNDDKKRANQIERMVNAFNSCSRKIDKKEILDAYSGNDDR